MVKILSNYLHKHLRYKGLTRLAKNTEKAANDNIIKEDKLYQALAKSYNICYVNYEQLAETTPLLKPSKRNAYLALTAFPWYMEQEVTVIVTSNINDIIIKWAKFNFKNYRFVISSPNIIRTIIRENYIKIDNFDACFNLALKHPQTSALHLFSKWQLINFLIFAIFTIACFRIKPALTLIISLSIINLLFLVVTIFKFWLFILGVFDKNEPAIAEIYQDDLPIYTILIPLYQESNIVASLIANMRKLNYPKHKLDIKILVENRDYLTISALTKLNLEPFFEVIKVPKSYPLTKPKALNYALKFVRGKYLTIYDGDDRPDPDQLLIAVKEFRQCSAKVVCLQAKLNYYNMHENILTRLFAIEYSLWFDFLLKGLQKMSIPLPLGGNSNHFITSKLLSLLGWDPFNVTEDADLGIRLAQAGYQTKLINSYTFEESPITVRAWLNQRTRWMKGHLQTYIVHSRQPLSMIKSIKFAGYIGFQLFIGMSVVAHLLTPILIAMTIIYFRNYDSADIPNYLILLCKFNLILLFILPFIQSHVIIQHNSWQNKFPKITNIIYPAYWLLHSLASLKAMFQLFKRPHFWDKTIHGVSKISSE